MNTRICKSWAKHTTAQIVRSLKLVTCGAGNVELVSDLQGLTGHQMILCDDNKLLLTNISGADCCMVLTEDELEVVSNLSEQAEAQMIAGYGY